MKYYLLKYEDNWADEFDVNTFCVMTEEEYNQFCAIIDEAISKIGNSEIEIYFGTNEWINVTPESFKQGLKVSEIDKDFYKGIIEHDLDDFGTIRFSSILESIEYTLQEANDE